LSAGIPLPVLTELAETLFFASLGAEEKELTRVALVWSPDGSSGLQRMTDAISSEPCWDLLLFEKPRPFDVDVLIKTAPVTDFGISVLVIGGSGGGLVIEGVAHRRPSTLGPPPLILVADSPGSVAIFVAGTEIFRFERGMFRRSTLDVFTDERCPVFRLLNEYASSLNLEPPFRRWSYPTHVARRLADSMRRTHHGGLLLFQPTEEHDSNAVSLPLKNPSFLKDLIVKANDIAVYLSRDQSLPDYEDEGLEVTRSRYAEATEDLHRAVNLVARLSAVDNAVLLGPGFSVIGAQFAVTSSAETLEVYEAHDETGAKFEKYDIKRHGSRHRAAVSFVSEAPGRLALLSSADGPLRCFLRHEGKVLFWHVRDRFV
jgi:hypothetical protein